MTTMTTRRTTRMSTAPRGYVAIKVDYVSAKTTRIACVANEAMHIEGTNGASVDLKAGEAFTLVRSESLGDNMFYIVREEVGVKKCSCPANKPCKHEVSLKAHTAEHGKPAIHLRATQIAAEASKARAAQAAEVVEVASVARELRNVFQCGEYNPQYRENGGDWQNFRDEHGYSIVFLGGYEEIGSKFILEDSDEHRASVMAELAQAVADAEARDKAYNAAEAAKEAQRKTEASRDLVAVAQTNAAKAGPAIDGTLIASTAASERRLTSQLNGNRGFSLMAK